MKNARGLVTLMLGVALCCFLSATAFASDYTVVPGDCLWRIARRELGEGVRWPEIYEANKQQIKNPHWIYPGQVFTIPNGGGETEAALTVSSAPTEEAETEQAPRALAGTPTDYADEGNWIAKPEVEKVADTLYFVGNCYYLSDSGKDDAICAIENRSMRVAARADLATNRAAYAETNVFAPYYRQAGVYKDKSVDNELLPDEPRADVYAALDYYFTRLNGGRPVRIVGREQGAELLRMVLEDYLRANPAYAARVTATVLE